MGNAFGPKPLVDVNLTTEFGGVEDLEQFKQDGVAQHDYTYVPGFSESRVARDLALGALARNEIRAGEVPTLDVNLRWFRSVKGSGSDPDQMRLAEARNKGYVAVTKADLGKPWMTALPPGSQIAPDGTIKTAAGDNVLMMATKEVAARNAMAKKIRAEEQIQGLEFSNVPGTAKSADPRVERTIGGSTQ